MRSRGLGTEELMLKRLLLIAIAALFAVSMASVGQDKGKVVIQVDKTAATNGKQMYTNYCAPCHGVDARGRGPVAPALNNAPADLTVLAKNNHGKFPDAHIVTVLQNGPDIPAHGTALMPVWGPIFMTFGGHSAAQVQLRVRNLTNYLESMQAK